MSFGFSFACHIASTRTFNAMLSGSSEKEYTCFIFDLGSIYSFAIWSDVRYRFFINAASQLKNVTFYPYSVETFYQ